MDQSPLVEGEIQSGARFVHEFQKFMPLQAAFWVKEVDVRDWYLYLASEQITDENFHTVYGEVGRIADRLKDPWFPDMNVKVIGADDPVAQAAMALQQRLTGLIPARRITGSFGGLEVDQVYIYPLSVPAQVS